jgi:hypothetical protein
MRTKKQTQERVPQAPRAPLPELAEFLAPLRVQCTQGPSAETLRQYLTGVLSEHPNKNCDTLAAIIPGTKEQQLQHLLTDMVWDETALNRQRIARRQTLASEGDGVRIFEDTGFEKKGRRAPVYGDRRQSDELPGDGQLSLRGADGSVAGGDAVVPAPRVGRGRGAVQAGARARGGDFSDQSRDCFGAAG